MSSLVKLTINMQDVELEKEVKQRLSVGAESLEQRAYWLVSGSGTLTTE